MTKINNFAQKDGAGLGFRFLMILFKFAGRLHISYSFIVISPHLGASIDIWTLIPGRKMTKFSEKKILVIFGPEINVKMSTEAPGCEQTDIKVIKSIQSTNTVGQMHLESKIRALSL